MTGYIFNPLLPKMTLVDAQCDIEKTISPKVTSEEHAK
jgi:hypothetical protein